MREKNFERQLPCGYKEILVIDAKSVKFNILANAAAIFILAGRGCPAWLLLRRDILMGTNPRWRSP